MPLDFKKLRDPAWQAEFRAKEEAQQAARDQKDTELREAVAACLACYEALPAEERSLVSACNHKLNTFGIISEKQEAWLRDIATRCTRA